jgi:choline dehydrogenase-like flavoprotein
MLTSGETKKGTFNFDICIVGGGASGIVIANELAETGLKVALVESGGEQYHQATQDLYKANNIDFPFPDTSYTRLRFLGGSSNHWQNNTSPLSPLDFEKREGIENSGWPIQYKELVPYYSKAEPYCGVDSDGYSLDKWLGTTGMKDITMGSSKIETRIAKAPFSPTRFFEQHGSNLVASENVEIITFSNIVDIEFDENSKRIERVIFNTLKRNEFVIAADKFIMCLGGIENARMLLHFNQKYNNKLGNQSDAVGRYLMEHPTPRAAHLMAEKTPALDLYMGYREEKKSISGFLSLSDEIARENNTINIRMPFIPQSNYTLSDGISSSHIFGQALSNYELPADASTHAWNILSDIDMVIEAIARKQFDTKIFEHASGIGGYEIPMMMEQTPDKNNRITLSSKKDKLGLAKINVEYRVTDIDKQRLWRSLDICAKEIAILDFGRLKTLKERSLRLWRDQLGFSAHHMGTTRMADNPNTGVVDKNLQVFGTKNFYISGSSVFPTGGSVPPTLTIVALSIRLADHIKSGVRSSES